MTDTKTILDMIETIDPSDTAKLDEIDSHVHVLLNDIAGDAVYIEFKRYTRSRDALKAIRPEYAEHFYIKNNEGLDDWIGSVWTCWINSGSDHLQEFRGDGPTEELAELHAIIQAISYDRGETS